MEHHISRKEFSDGESFEMQIILLSCKKDPHLIHRPMPFGFTGVNDSLPNDLDGHENPLHLFASSNKNYGESILSTFLLTFVVSFVILLSVFHITYYEM